MKICVPAVENKGLETIPYGHFGSAPQFIVVDSDSKEVSVINNGDLGHEHGKCQPLKALEGQMVDVVLVRGIGAGAIAKLNSMGTKVFQAVEDSIEANMKLLNENKLMEFTVDHACNHHDCGHH